MRAAILMFSCVALYAQTFEVASIKRADPSRSMVDLRTLPGGRLQVVNLTLAEMIHAAYELKSYQRVEGVNGWPETDRFNIDATAGREASRQEVMAMLRALLEERFRLKVRRDSHEGNIYELVIAKGTPKLKRSAAETSYVRLIRHTPPQLPGVRYSIAGQKATVANLVDHLMGTVGRPVVDRTGIEGEYDFTVEYAVEGHADEGPSIFTALQEQLGLKLQAAKGLIETLTIESAERPTEN